MHALVVRVTIHDADETREVLNGQVVPQLSAAPGFKAGYWSGNPEIGRITTCVIFESEEELRAAEGGMEQMRTLFGPLGIRLESVEKLPVFAAETP